MTRRINWSSQWKVGQGRLHLSLQLQTPEPAQAQAHCHCSGSCLIQGRARWRQACSPNCVFSRSVLGRLVA